MNHTSFADRFKKYAQFVFIFVRTGNKDMYFDSANIILLMYHHVIENYIV